MDKLDQTLCAYRLALDEAMPLFANLLSLPIPEDRYPPLSMSPQGQRQKTLETIMAMLLQQAAQQPVLFILVDLHWTDPCTLELLGLLIDQVPTTTICALFTCRPNFQPPWGSLSYLSQVTHNRLSRNQVEYMVERVAGGKRLPDEVLKQLIEKTDGVPLYVEEMTKAIIESGNLKEVNGQYKITGSLASLSIPSTLQDSLMSRLDRLMTAKVIAQLGATIGRQFSYRLLHAVSQLDEVTLQRELGRLVEAELVYQRGVPPQVAYTFKHALIQDAAYTSLLRSTRQQYHYRIAHALEEQFPETAETQPELLAYHYSEAGLAEQAVGCWRQAGEQAIQRSANVEAIDHLTKGLASLNRQPDSPERARQEITLQRHLGVALLATKGFADSEVESVFTRARELCEQVGDTSQMFPALYGLWGFCHVRSGWHTGRGLAEQLLVLAQRQKDRNYLLQAHRAIGDTLFFLGEPLQACNHLEQAFTLYDSRQHHAHAFLYGQDPAVGCLGYMALSLWYLGYPDQAVARSRESIQLAQNLSHPFSLAQAHNSAAHLFTLRREWQKIQTHAEATIALSTEHGFGYALAQGTYRRGLALAVREDDTGILLMRQAITDRQSRGAAVRPTQLIPFAEALKMKKHNDEALNILSEAMVQVDKTEERMNAAELHRLKGDLLLVQSSPGYQHEAETCFHQAIDIARRQQAKSLELRAATSLARLWQSQGKRQDAYDLLAPVYDWFTEGFDTADLKDAKALLQALSPTS